MMRGSPTSDGSLFKYSHSSSPFESTMAEDRNRSPSKSFQASLNAAKRALMESTADAAVERGLDNYDLDPTTDDKENTLGAPKLPPHKSSARSNQHNSAPREGDLKVELMPPPTIRTPRRSPFKATPVLKDSSEFTSRPAVTVAQQKVDSQLRQDSTGIDDTCYSTFSEAPDLTQLTRHAQSPSKRVDALLSITSPHHTPRTSRKRSSPSRSPSPTSRRLRTPDGARDGTQTFLIDFTTQIENMGKAAQLPSSRTDSNLLQHLNRQRSPGKGYRQSLATPAKQSSILNLLDFELPPAPTPRSIPTITVRELETLKSQYLSQISGLKATLSGREAEVESLKRAVGDAERRVGDAQQALKEEKNRREHAEQERSDWERRGLEVENVLKNVREEVLKSESEREDLLQKTEEMEKHLELTDARAVRAEHDLAEAIALRSASESGEHSANLEEQVQQLVASQIDAKIEAVSRELHAVYKEKHERKVATLKKSYEARSEKRCAEMQAKVKELETSNHELESSKRALLDTSTLPPPSEDASLKAQIEEHKAHLARIEEELATSRAQQGELVRALEQERIEKGDLVAAVDEMLALQSDQTQTQAAVSVVEDFRRSISRPASAMSSGLRRPSESRIGKIPTTRTPSSNKSRMLANIEKMGRSTLHDP